MCPQHIARRSDDCNSLRKHYNLPSLPDTVKPVPVDMVNHPPHYEGKLQCIDVIEYMVKDLTGEKAFLTGQVVKYMWRWKKKGGREDLEKAQWYLSRLIGKPNES
jgi:Protein of unknwon function (DUF3310)